MKFTKTHLEKVVRAMEIFDGEKFPYPCWALDNIDPYDDRFYFCKKTDITKLYYKIFDKKNNKDTIIWDTQEERLTSLCFFYEMIVSEL